MGKIIFFTGAGLSAPSGIKTFRETDGTWENYHIEDVCYEPTWKQNRDLVHKFYNERRQQLKDVKPNEGHLGIKRISDTYETINITQNVDDLLERAGCTDVIHLHGFLKNMECYACGHVWNIEYEVHKDLEDSCPKCSSKKGVRPFIVFFGGQAPEYLRLRKIVENISKEDILIVIGTMGNVVNINEYIKRINCHKILCNLEESPYIDDSNFDKVYYESIDTAIFKIEEYINSL